MDQINEYDLIVIGGGPGGYVASIRAAQLGMKVACIEKENVGGICLNWGCIPTKALLKSASIYNSINHAKDFGISVDGLTFDFTKIISRSRKISNKLTTGVKFLLKKHKIELYKAHAYVNGLNKVTFKDKNSKQTLTGKNIIIATGAHSKNLPNISSDVEFIWNYKDAMIPEAIPKSLLIVGSGAIGIEFASFYNTFGVQVTVVELLDKILPSEDAEISSIAKKNFTNKGVNILTNTSLSHINKTKSGVECTLKTFDGKSQKSEFDKVLLAIGIEGNVSDIGLETLPNLKISNNQIITNEWSETSVPSIYAIGDVTGGPWLAHKAMHEAIICVEKIAGLKNIHPMNKQNIPGCTYSDPQVASIGLTEQQALEQGYPINVGRFPFIGNGKAIAMNEEEGLIKTIFDKNTGELLGAHMIGPEVTELIQGYAIAKSSEITEHEIINTIFPHPTLSEMMHESVLDAFNRALHI
ncbi:dihydrolipoyl dehydrogenase [Alphaproteobacteria bacterium]|nr:dihydrolipoyl dehydrogenase [Alphaproteobacteria bacterium]